MSWPPARLLTLVFPVKYVRRSRPPRGPFVAAINHLSHVDPPLACVAAIRPTRMLALDELWGNSRIIDWLFGTYGVIALPREDRRPIGAVRAALRELDAGGSVGLFPEARRVESWGDAELKRGAAWLAVKSGAKLVPMAVWGTQNAMPLDSLKLRRARIEFVICEPLDPADFAGEDDPIGALTEAWRLAIDAEMTRMRAG